MDLRLTKHLWRLLFAIMTIVLLNSCGQSYGKLESGDLVATGDAVDVKFTSSKILCSANIDVLLGKEYRLGVIYQPISDMDEVAKKNNKFNYDDSERQSVDDLIGNKYEVKLGDLKPSTEYQYRAYVKAGDKYYYGKIETFTTKDVKRYVSVSTGDADEVKSLSASVSYSLDIDDAEVRMLNYESGVIYSNSIKDDDELEFGGDYNISYCRGEDDAVAKLSSLSGNSEYRYRAFCSFGRDVVVYGKVKKLKTANPKDFVSISTGNVTSKSSEANVDFTLNINEEGIRNSYYNAGVIYSKSATTPDKLHIDESGVIKTTSENGYDCSVSDLSPLTTYYYRAYFECGETVIYGDVKSFTTQKFEGYVKQAVDLGLSVKWAACNLGATKPEGYGGYYAWGETKTKKSYDDYTCDFDGVDSDILRRRGVIDSRGNLTSKYDAARANWGGKWRMPTEDEFDELCRRCTWTRTKQKGVYGYKVKGPSGKEIFLPAAGNRDGTSSNNVGSRGYYWSSTVYESNSYYAYSLYFYSGSKSTDYYYRDYGRSVRPVSE